MANIKPEDLRALVTQLNLDGLGEIASKIQKTIEKGEQLTRKQINQVKKLRDSAVVQQQTLLKQLINEEKALHRMTEAQKSANAAKKMQFEIVEKAVTGYDSLIDSSEKATKSTKKFGDMQSVLVTKMRDSATAIAHNVSVIGILDTAVRAVEALYNRWFSIQAETTQAMGQLARATGQSSSEMDQMRVVAEGMREEVASLGGSLVGMADSLQILQEINMGMRTQSQLLTAEFILQLRAMGSLGVGIQGASETYRLLQAGINGGSTDLGVFAIEMQEFATSIGANASQMSQEFLDARDSLALFGEDGTEVFQRTATVANHLGFETRRLLEMARQFDTFGRASEHVNSLNAMFGTTLSSVELLMEEDPVARLDMITDAIREQGYTWNEMSRQQRAQIAQTLGVSESEAMRVVNGEDMSEILAEQEQTQARQLRVSQAQEDIQVTLLEMVERTRTRFASWTDQLEMIWLMLAEELSPLFEVIYNAGTATLTVFRDWVRTIVSDPQFRDVLQNISKWIADMPQRLQEFLPTWDEIQKTATEMWPTIERIGSTLMSIFDFAVEHPGLIAAVIGVGLAAQLAPLVLLLAPPQGLLILGVLALAAGFDQASRNAGELQTRMTEIAARQRAGTADVGDNISSNYDRPAAMNDIDSLGGMGRMGQASASLLGNGVSQAINGVNIGIADAAGFETLSNILRTDGVSSRDIHNRDARSMAQRALASGHSPQQVHAMMMAQIQEDQAMDWTRGGAGRDTNSAESAITSSMGLSAGPSLSSDLMAELNRMGASVPHTTSSAVDSAPITSGTTSAPASTGSSVDVMVRDITMEARRIGQVFFEVTRR